MAALNHTSRLRVRAPKVGEGVQIARLWRELWEAHEGWGGYPGSRDDQVYAHLGARLDDDARVRAGNPVLGRHIHLFADVGSGPCGQVEGWLDQHGGQAATPFTCEVRSLIVTSRERRCGVGRILLNALAAVARALAGRSTCVLAAEVLEPNPAHVFYTRLGYAPVAWSARLPALSDPVRPISSITARLATPEDATAIACLEAILATRRRDAGDARFDGPRVMIRSSSPPSLRISKVMESRHATRRQSWRSMERERCCGRVPVVLLESDTIASGGIVVMVMC